MRTTDTRILERLEQMETRLLQAQDTPLSQMDAARYLGIAKKTLYNLISLGKVKAYRPSGGKTIFFKSDLDKFIKGSN